MLTDENAKLYAATARSVEPQGEAIAALLSHLTPPEIAAALGVALAYAMREEDDDSFMNALDFNRMTALAGRGVLELRGDDNA